MQPGRLTKSLVLAVLIAAGCLVPSLIGTWPMQQADVVKRLSTSPVTVTPLDGARG